MQSCKLLWALLYKLGAIDIEIHVVNTLINEYHILKVHIKGPYKYSIYLLYLVPLFKYKNMNY